MTKERLRSRLADWYSRIIVVFAAVFTAQIYTIELPPYLDLRKYALGQERMPFQARELMRYPLLWAGNSAFLQRHTTGRAGMNSPERLVLMLVTFAAILLSVWAAQKIDRMYWPKARVPLLPFAVLIVVFFFDFYLSVPFSFPYDPLSMMFLGWGLYLVLADRFWWLLPLFALATWNRETTVFLILARGAVALSSEGRWRLRAVKLRDVVEVAVLCAVWAAIILALHHKYAANPTEAGSRIVNNLQDLSRPVLWPAIVKRVSISDAMDLLETRFDLRAGTAGVCVAVTTVGADAAVRWADTRGEDLWRHRSVYCGVRCCDSARGVEPEREE